ncbi:MAG: SocA family protein [Synergistaceae bacterium]|jgi:hypothetical protein|nr:SocA family protein [Synergistaceae bacterium]
MEFPEKLKCAVRYVVSACDPIALGNVRLNKILWKADVFTYMRTGESITNWKYIKKRYGPMIKGYDFLMSELEEKGLILKDYATKGGREICLIEAAGNDDSSEALSQEEKDVLDNFIDYITRKTAQSISEESHDKFYSIAADGEEIPLGPVWVEPSAEDILWAEQLVEDYDKVQA